MQMKHLAAVCSLPYATPSGQIVARPGYNPETGIYLNLPHDYSFNVPARPDAAAVRRAVAQMMSPWRAYRFSDEDSAAAMVAAVLAAVCRPVLDLCPGWFFDASQQAAGKSRCALALGAVVEGQVPAATPFTASISDEEIRKRLLASVVAGTRFELWDNITKHFHSASLAAAMTSGKISDRVLGQSRNASGRLRFLLTLSGNQCSLSGDASRRLCRVRIDGGVDPKGRMFDFDPVQEALSQRLAIAEAACVIWGAYHAAGAPAVFRGDAGGWRQFARMCRNPVGWLAREGLADGLPWVLGDPAGSLLAASEDPDDETTGEILKALWSITKGECFTAADALKWYTAGEHAHGGHFHGLHVALTEATPRPVLSAKSMGRVLKGQREKARQGLELRGREDRDGMVWRVLQAVGGV